jgi:3-hydroxyacyl-CoA dehydrogenase/enoyl-CoA hydratase/3-hydroxybutyryl-CoA epimerase/enoyl-CoA isomerase
MNLQHPQVILPRVILVGAGVVGRAILKSHIDAGVSLQIADQDSAAIHRAVAGLSLDPTLWKVTEGEPIGASLPSITIHGRDDDASRGRAIVIESIAEKLEVKRAFFQNAETWFDNDAILCSNTSTLRISQIADGLGCGNRLCGMHFFMPVDQRWAVELVRTVATTAEAIDVCKEHVHRIKKTPLSVRDSPGFIVNRLLSPYLNEAMLLLCRGVAAEQLERAAIAYGMPMSPLELIDWIGTRTMFDAGRAFWQAFPSRFDPAPMLGALIKAKRMGRVSGAGFFDYAGEERSEHVAPITRQLSETYERNRVELSDEEVMLMLSIPMWIEAALAYREGVVTSPDDFDLAMRGGLGYQWSSREGAGSWLDFFDSLGSQRMLSFIHEHGPSSKSLRVPRELVDALERRCPSVALSDVDR